MSEEKRFTLRMDSKLFNEIKRSAEKNRRSIAKEIEYILFQWTKLDPNAHYDHYDTFGIEVDGKPLYEDEEK